MIPVKSTRSTSTEKMANTKIRRHSAQTAYHELERNGQPHDPGCASPPARGRQTNSNKRVTVDASIRCTSPRTRRREQVPTLGVRAMLHRCAALRRAIEAEWARQAPPGSRRSPRARPGLPGDPSQ
jgi:hypothetical protein